MEVIKLPNITISCDNFSVTYKDIEVPIYKFEDDWAYIHPSEWAPGIWAGTEGMSVQIGANTYRVVVIDLNKRKVKLLS